MAQKELSNIGEQARRSRRARDIDVGIKIRAVAYVVVVFLIVSVAWSINPSYDMFPVLALGGIAIVLYFLYHWWLGTERFLEGLIWFSMSIDLAVATTAVYLTGGIESPMMWLYLLAVLSWGHLRGWKMGTTAGIASCLLLYLVVWSNYFDVLPHFPLLPLGKHFYQDRDVVLSLSLLYSGMSFLMGPLSAYIVSIVGGERERSSHISGVQSLVVAVEANDPRTKGHSERVADYAVVIARELRYKPEDIARLRDAALLHDVGKIFLSHDVVNNPGALTAAQQASMITHPLLSYEILQRSGTMADLLPAVRHHHEWYSGGGYPDGLSGEDIPLDARILAVADAFEAMTAGRSYRPRLSFDDAAQELVSGKGRQVHWLIYLFAGLFIIRYFLI